MTWFIICWLIGALLSWIGVVIYAKTVVMMNWKEIFVYAKGHRETTSKELLKWLLYIAIWPIEIFAFIYSLIPVYKNRQIDKES